MIGGRTYNKGAKRQPEALVFSKSIGGGSSGLRDSEDGYRRNITGQFAGTRNVALPGQLQVRERQVAALPLFWTQNAHIQNTRMQNIAGQTPIVITPSLQLHFTLYQLHNVTSRAIPRGGMVSDECNPIPQLVLQGVGKVQVPQENLDSGPGQAGRVQGRVNSVASVQRPRSELGKELSQGGEKVQGQGQGDGRGQQQVQRRVRSEGRGPQFAAPRQVVEGVQHPPRPQKKHQVWQQQQRVRRREVSQQSASPLVEDGGMGGAPSAALRAKSYLPNRQGSQQGRRRGENQGVTGLSRQGMEQQKAQSCDAQEARKISPPQRGALHEQETSTASEQGKGHGGSIMQGNRAKQVRQDTSSGEGQGWAQERQPGDVTSLRGRWKGGELPQQQQQVLKGGVEGGKGKYQQAIHRQEVDDRLGNGGSHSSSLTLQVPSNQHQVVHQGVGLALKAVPDTAVVTLTGLEAPDSAGTTIAPVSRLSNTPSTVSVASTESSWAPTGAILMAGDGAITLDNNDEIAMLRARLAKVEAQNTVLQEGNFDLVASMQLIEVEAKRQLEREMHRFKSELAFKAHQLSLAEGQHNRVAKELEAEQGKRKRDRQQMEEERAAAVAATVAAKTSTADANDTNADHGTPILPEEEVSPSGLEGPGHKHLPGRVACLWKSLATSQPRDTHTLAGVVLSEMSDDVLVLLNPRGTTSDSLSNGGWDEAFSGRTPWFQTPDSRSRKKRARGMGGGFSTSLGCFFSPLTQYPATPRNNSCSFLPGGGYSSCRRRCLGGEEKWGRGKGGGGRRRGQRDDSSPLPLAFTPGRLAGEERRRQSETPGKDWGHSSQLSRDWKGCNRGKMTGSPSSGYMWGVMPSAAHSLGHLGGGKGEKTVSGMLWKLSRQFFVCLKELLEGKALAGDLLGVLMAYMETLGPDCGRCETSQEDYKAALISAVRVSHLVLSFTPDASATVARDGIDGGGLAEGADSSVGNSRVQCVERGQARQKAIASSCKEMDKGKGEDKERERCQMKDEKGCCKQRLYIAGAPVGSVGVNTLVPGAEPRAAEVAVKGMRERLGVQFSISAMEQGNLQVGTHWSWEGRASGEDIGRRMKKMLIAILHKAAVSCPVLTEAVLQAILTVLWDLNNPCLAQWGCLLDGQTFSIILFNQSFAVKNLATQVLQVLSRDQTLFSRMVLGDKEAACTSYAPLCHGNRTSLSTSAVTNATAPPTPPSTSRRKRWEKAEERARGEVSVEVVGNKSNGILRQLCVDVFAAGHSSTSLGYDALQLRVVRLSLFACRVHGAKAARLLVQEEGGECEGASEGGYSFGRGFQLVPRLIGFIRQELDQWEERRDSQGWCHQATPASKDGDRLLKESFQLLWALAIHKPLPLKDMVQGPGVFHTMVSVVSRFFNSVEMENFGLYKEAGMLMELIN